MAVSRHQSGAWPLELLRKLGNPNTSDTMRWSVDVGDDWIAVSNATRVVEDYDEDDISLIHKAIGDVDFYILESRTDRIMACYIKALPDHSKILIDNDHGWIAPVEAYKAAILAGVDWLYTKPPPTIYVELPNV